jgi:hypothetical protein
MQSSSHLLDQVHFLEGSIYVIFVAENQYGNIGERRLAEELVQLVPGLLQGLRVGRIHHIPTVTAGSDVPWVRF